VSANSHICDDQLLLAMVREELPPDTGDGLLDHIETCAHCQQRLDDLVASKADWERTTAVFAGASSAVDTSPPLEIPRLGQPPVAWTESMAGRLLSPPTHPEMLGRLGRYDVERVVGSGGMGVVFKAYDGELNRPVAIKLLAPHLASSGPARKRFAREARAAAAVVHQHVVPIHNVETEGENPFLVMQFVSGTSLQDRIDRVGALKLCEILRIGMQVADGLSAAHQQGLVHRDIKPSNILLEEDVDRALITDFGLARAVDDASLTRSGFHPGTPQYMSPEQASGQSVDARSDLFSLGSMLYTMCTGRPPFRAENSLGVMRRITEAEPTPIREINPDIPDWFCRLVAWAMAKSKTERFQSASELHELLEECLGHTQQPTTHPLPAALQPKPRFSLRSHSMKAALGVVALVLVSLGVSAGLLVRSYYIKIIANSDKAVLEPLSALDEYIASMMRSPHELVFLNLGKIGKDDNYIVLTPVKGGVQLRFPAFDSHASARRQGKYANKLKEVVASLSLTLSEQSEVAADGTVSGVNFQFEVTGDPTKVAATVNTLITQTFQVENTEECSYQYRNIQSQFSTKEGEAPTQVTAAAFVAEAKSGNRVYLGEQLGRVYLAYPETAALKQVPWNHDIWFIDVRELPAGELAAIRKGPAQAARTEPAE
jgi:serine/threonine protein kinase